MLIVIITRQLFPSTTTSLVTSCSTWGHHGTRLSPSSSSPYHRGTTYHGALVLISLSLCQYDNMRIWQHDNMRIWEYDTGWPSGWFGHLLALDGGSLGPSMKIHIHCQLITVTAPSTITTTGTPPLLLLLPVYYSTFNRNIKKLSDFSVHLVYFVYSMKTKNGRRGKISFITGND